MSVLPVEPAYRLAERAEEHRWLVAGLWSDEAVGIVGGEPKCCKSFLALDLAVSVASGAPCLRRFAVPEPGRVLLYAAEDALHVVRRRLDGIAAAAGMQLADLDIQVITAPTLRLDLEADRRNLAETVDRLRPRLLILDPFARLHRIDENASGEVAPLLAYLRELQRRYGVAVLVVHHARKGGACVRAGQTDGLLRMGHAAPIPESGLACFLVRLGGRFLVPASGTGVARRGGQGLAQARPTGLVLDGPEHGARLGRSRDAPAMPGRLNGASFFRLR